MAVAESAVVLPVLVLDCVFNEETQAAAAAPTGSRPDLDLHSVFNAISSHSNAQDAVRSFVDSTEERYGFGEVARLFDRMAKTLNLD